MLIDYISGLEHAEYLCDELEKRVEQIFYQKGISKPSIIPNHCLTTVYQDVIFPVKACVKLCEILKFNAHKLFMDSFLKATSNLEDIHQTKSFHDFKVNLEFVKSNFIAAKDELLTFCSAFDDEEKERINEAIHGFFENCNYSCVAMSVSAAESRLLKLMCLSRPDLSHQLQDYTLGQLLSEYAKNKVAYKRIIPKKHEPLLQLCNTYRIPSVHPKKQVIKGTIAGSILNLALEFLTDHETQPEIVRAQLIANE